MNLKKLAVWLAAALTAMPALASDDVLLGNRRLTDSNTMTLKTRTGEKSAFQYRFTNIGALRNPRFQAPPQA
jgi:hypothetical protein